MADEPIASVWINPGVSLAGRLTKYERALAIGRRAHQIGLGQTPLVDVSDLDDALAMATRELYANKNPLVVRRYHPNHTPESPRFEDFRVATLSI